MRQTVTDISDVLKNMSERLEEMRKTIDSQHETICSLNRNIDRLNVEVCKRNARIEELERLDALLKRNLEGFKKQFGHLRKGLIKCRDNIFNFLEYPLIPPDNNASERGIRKLKIKLKNSGTFRSDFGADAFFDLHFIVETAKKHKQTPLEAIRALFCATDNTAMTIAE